MELSKYRKQDQIYGYLFISPILAGFLLFITGPLIAGIAVSFSDWSVLSNNINFVGLKNYVDLIKNPDFYKVVFNTFYFAAGVVPLNIIFALSLAMALNNNIPGIGFFRTAIFTPVITTLVIWSMVWQFIFAPSGGVLNQLLLLVGIAGPNWLHDTRTAMPCVIVISSLKNVGINMTIILASIQGIPKMYYESAMIDGASGLKKFFYITLPMISPTLFAIVIVTIVGSLKVFGQIYVMTQGGPMNSTSVWAYDIYKRAFEYMEIGSASASSFLLFLALLSITLFQWYMKKRWVHHE